MAFSKIYLLSILVFLIPFAYAAPDAAKAGDWIANHTNFEQDIETVSFSLLALSLSDHAGDAQRGVARLLDRQDPAGCWPKGNCRVKDTALAVLASNRLNKPVSAARSWLLSSRIPAKSTGKFWIQIASASDGQCRITADGKQKIFTLKNGNIVECGNKPWIESTCIDANLLRSSVEKKVDVDCSSLQDVAIISLIYQQGNSYYIIQEQHSNLASLTLSNACLGNIKSASVCDYDATLFASLAMKSLGQNIGTQTYLESNIQSNNIPGYSILYVLTKKDLYRDILSQKQLASGSFSNVYQTGIALLAIKDTPAGNNASSWLELQQSEDGSWNRNIRDTSVALYGLLFQDFQETGNECVLQGYQCCSACSLDGDAFRSLDSSCSQGEVCCSECEAVVISTCSELGGIECNFDQRCTGQIQDTKDSLYCCIEGSCQDIEKTTSTIQPSCNFNDVCDLDETIESCPNDCKEKSNLFLWIMIGAFAILIIAAIYYLMKKKPGLFKKKEKQEFRTGQRPAYPVSRPVARQPILQSRQLPRRKQVRSKIEQELEKSLEEAKKLLKEDKK